jgi:hypothetical protein
VGVGGSFPVGSVWGMKLITHLHLVPRLKNVELYIHSPYTYRVWYLINHTDNFTFYWKYWYVIQKSFRGTAVL